MNPISAQPGAVAGHPRSLNDLLDGLATLDAEHRFHIVTSKGDVRVTADQISVGDDNLRMSVDGWDRLAQQCGAPSDYWSRLTPAFRAEVAQHHLSRGDLFRGKSRVRSVEAVSRNGSLIGFRHAGQVHLNNATTLRAVLETLRPQDDALRVHRFVPSETDFHVELVTPRSFREVRQGDVVQGGIAVSHSLLGAHPTTIDLFVLRVVCSNGLALRRCVGRVAISRTRRLKHTGPEALAAATDQLRRITAERWQHLSQLLSGIRELPSARLPRTASSPDADGMRSFLMPPLRATHLWSEDLWHRLLLPAWQHPHGGNGELDEFAAINTVTYVATHRSELTFRQQRTLARLAGLLAFRRIHVCPRCHSAVVGP